MKTELEINESFKLINQVINESRSRYNEKGFDYIFWGLLTSVASFSSYYLLSIEKYTISYYPYFLLALGGLVSFCYHFFKKRDKRSVGQIEKVISGIWILLTLNIMLLAFGFGAQLKGFLIPIILILLAIGNIVSGLNIKSRVLLISGIVLNIAGFLCIELPLLYHPLLMGCISILTILIPGILLNNNYKREKNA